MKKIIITVCILILSPIVIFITYNFIRDIIFPEIGIYKSNTTAFLAFYYKWKDGHPNANENEFPIQEALLKTLYTRYPEWSQEKRERFIEEHNITNCNELVYEIAKFELPLEVFKKYKQRYGNRNQ